MMKISQEVSYHTWLMKLCEIVVRDTDISLLEGKCCLNFFAVHESSSKCDLKPEPVETLLRYVYFHITLLQKGECFINS